MDGRKGVLQAIQSDPTRGEAILRAALEADPKGVIMELAAFLSATLDGCVPDPGKL